jgi:transcriptional regulator with XRE-family HTH domain
VKDFHHALLGRAMGDVIESARKRRGFTRWKLADEIGCARTYLYKIEVEGNIPKITQLMRIAEALDTTAWNLLRCAENRLNARGNPASSPKPPSPQTPENLGAQGVE